MRDYYVIQYQEREGAKPSFDQFTNWSSIIGDVPRLFDTVADATLALAHVYDPKRLSVVTLPASMWRAREAHKLLTEEYEPVPWLKCAWFCDKADVYRDHMPRRSVKDPTKVAFTEDDTKGAADRQTLIKPGKFLTKFYSDVLTPEEIADLANRYVASAEPGRLCFASTPDDIEAVYLNGPSSCMSHPADDYSSPFHPTRVYGAGDLAIAHIRRGEEVTARAICWPEKKVYGRVYGDKVRLVTALADAGFVEALHHEFSGARLIRHETDDGRFVLPYVDGPVSSVNDDGDYLVLHHYGDIDAQSTDGLSDDTRPTCDCCGDHYDEGTGSEVGGDYWCEDCVCSRATYSEREGEYVSENNVTGLADGSYVSDWYFEEYGYQCGGNGNFYIREEYPPVTLADGTEWSPGYFEDHGFICAVTGEAYDLDDGIDHPELGMIHVGTDEAIALQAAEADASDPDQLSLTLEQA